MGASSIIDAMLKKLARQLIPLRRRHQLRLLFGGYPFPLRKRYPDLGMMELRPGAVVVDVGANIGQFAESALAYQPLAQVHSFEPIRAVFETLRARLGGVGDIRCVQAALGNETGSREFVVLNYDQCSSFLEVGERLREGVPELDLAADHTEVVQVRRLADYVAEQQLSTIDLLKLDVQGFELEVLRGAEEILPRVQWIYTEAQFQQLYEGGPMFEDLDRFLRPHGFELVRMTSFRRDKEGKLLECDMVFQRRPQRNGGESGIRTHGRG